MFQRRHPESSLDKIRQIVWPKMGWWRLLKYYRSRIIRLSASAESIAVNLAGGSAMSFTPFFGIHVFTALGFAWLIGVKMNLVAAMVGTFVGNPWTFPFLLFSSYSLGEFILGVIGSQESTIAFTPDIVEQQGDNLFTFLWQNFSDLFIPTAIGGTILAIMSFPFYYILYFYLVRGAQRARKLRMKRRQKALFNRKSKGPKIK
jgi:uncharacterized protein (DUF2062 family)